MEIRHQLEELKSSTTASGVRFATMLGTCTTPTWCANNLDMNKPLEFSLALLMARDLVRYGWMMWHALEASQISMIAATVGGENIIVLTAVTQV